MATMTDFVDWLSGAEIESHQEIYCVYMAVFHLEEWGAFTCTERDTSKGKMYFLKCCYLDDVLMLASAKAKDAFLKHIEVTYVTKGMDIESWYYYKESIEKND